MHFTRLLLSTEPSAAEFEVTFIYNITMKEPDLRDLSVSQIRRTKKYGMSVFRLIRKR